MKSKTLERLLKENPEDVKIFVSWYADIVVRINEILKDKGISKKDLAEGMDKKPSEISKWLNGEHNFTLRSLAKLSAELGENLIEVPKKTPEIAFVKTESTQSLCIVVRRVKTVRSSAESNDHKILWRRVNKYELNYESSCA